MATVILDAGHGGSDFGAVGPDFDDYWWRNPCVGGIPWPDITSQHADDIRERANGQENGRNVGKGGKRYSW